MKNRKLANVGILAALGITFSGCAAVGFLPSLIPSLIPSVDVNNINVNQNEINCFSGSYFSSSYCSIPISKFVGLSSMYTDPLNDKLLFYSVAQNSLAIDSLHQEKTIDKLNQFFLTNYPEPQVMAKLPRKLQSIYIKMREKYIPNKDYANMYKSYVYLYTISAINFASKPCDVDNKVPVGIDMQTYTTMKVFTIQFTNNILYYVYNHVDGNHSNEMDLYNDVYSEILNIDAYKLVHMSKSIYDQTKSFTPKDEWNEIFTPSGISYGEIGNFSCTDKGDFMYRYGYQYYGIHTNGLDLQVKYNIQDTLKNTNNHTIPVTNN